MPAFNKILDTFLFRNSEIYLKEFHIDRVFETYRFLKADVTHEEIINIFESIEKQLRPEADDMLIRVLFDPVRPHKHTIESSELDQLKSPVTLVIADATEEATTASQYKFADRPQWETLLNSRPEGSDDVVVVRDGQLVETSRFNLFLHDKKNDFIMTPTLKSGCLNGVLRRFALRQGFLELPDEGEVEVIEEDFSVEDLEGNQLYVGNSVRGLLPAKLI